MKRMKRLLAILTVLAMVVTSVPNTFWATAYAAQDSSSTDTRVADNTTLDGWQQYFGTDDKFTTQYSGHVWTDKSVTTDATKFGYAAELAGGGDTIALNSDDQNNFLVSLSAMASSKAVTGESTAPTDTMIILDLSSSMYKSRDPSTVKTMLSAVNDSIAELQSLNEFNRVGVTIYYGDDSAYVNSDKSFSKILLPLDRYTHSTNTFLKATGTSSKLTGVKVNSGVKNSLNKSVAETTHTVADIAGTYAQLGILDALNEFKEEYTAGRTTVEVNGVTQTRVPIFLFMSDGEPTAGSNIFYKKSDAVMGWNRVDDRNPDETDFVTQLTAAYAKRKADEWYVNTKPFFYTLSLGSSVSLNVMDPAKNSTSGIDGYWDTLMSKNAVTLDIYKWSDKTTKSHTVTRYAENGITYPVSKADKNYVDKMFTASTAGDLADAFGSILDDISLQTHTYPTLVDGDENLDGYISFVDKIGKYMNVTDVKGILMGTTWYSGKELSKNFVQGGGELGTIDSPTALGDELVWSIQQRLGLSDSAVVRTLLGLAYQYGQLSYDSATGEYSNYVGWYSDASGDYLGFWQEGATRAPDNAAFKNKSYMYLGKTDKDHGVKDSDMMYTTVRVRENIATGEQSVSFAVPAALIPTVEYDVELNESDQLVSVAKGGADSPVRLVYEVALHDSVNEITLNDVIDADYINDNTNTDGSVNFYTNQYDADMEVGYGKVNTYSYFRPSHQNENYYYQENETVYKDITGTEYNSSEEPDPKGKFYREITVYSKDNETINAENIYRQLSEEAIGTAVPRADGTWYVPKGNVHVNMDGYTIKKDVNATGTLPNANMPYVDVNGHHVNDTDHSFVIGDTLGNNGKVKLMPATGLKITKVVEGVDSSVDLTKETFEFAITADAELNADCRTVKIAADGTETSDTLTFKNGKTTVSLKAGESIYITGLAPNLDFTVTEFEKAKFVVSKVKVDGTEVAGTAASGTTSANEITETEFTNVPRGEGVLTVAKVVEHPLGTDYKIPENKTFTVNVTLESIAVDAGKEFKVERSGNTELETVTADRNKSFELVLRNGDQVKISGIPEGTKATVTEENPGAAFTVTYKENGIDGDGVIEEIVKAPTVDNVTVINKYEPAPAEVKINLSGTKTLVDEDGKLIPKEDWEDLTFKFIIQKYVYEDGEWKWINTESVDTADKTDDEVDFLNGGRTLTFDEVGTYGYQVIEENHGMTIDGIVYDATMHTFDVVVTDTDFDGKLEATVVSSHGKNNFVFENNTYINNQINFVNKNNQGETTALIMIKKALENESLSPNVSLEGYQFELYESNADYSETGKLVQTTPATDAAGESYVYLEYEYDEAGTATYYYKLKEKATGIDGMTDSDKVYNIKVVVTADDEGHMSAEVSGKDLTKFNSAVSGIEYELATFQNVYNPTDATVTLDVTKKLENKTLKADDFEFQLKKGETVIDTAKNKADGSVDFKALTFDKVGTYEYTVQETTPSGDRVTVDGTVYDVIITVTDNNGALKASVDVVTIPGTEMVFENKYTPEPVDIQLSGEKELKGKELIGGQFAFTLAETDAYGKAKEGGLKQTVTNSTDGTFVFDKISYDKEGMHYYVISEAIPDNKQGIIYDKTKYLVTVQVGYNKDEGEFVVNKAVHYLDSGDEASIRFKNEYKADPTTAVISGHKALDGRTLAAGQFAFNLYESDDSWTKGTKLQTSENDASGYFGFQFPEEEFDTAGTYYYIIDEVDKGAAGYTYDDKEVGIIITVTDDMKGQLHAAVSYVELTRDSGKVTESEVGAATFDNTYTISGEAVVELNGEKTLDGRNLQEGEFTFVLTDVTDKEKPVDVATAVNGADGKFAFNLTYTADDVGKEYTYMLTEKAGADDVGITYDDDDYKITVKVSDNGDGTIKAEVSVNEGPFYLFKADGLDFENKYKTTSTKVTFKGNKTLTGRELSNKEFEFEITADTQGAPMPKDNIVKNNGTSFEFDEITFDKAGSYTYKISEVIPADAVKDANGNYVLDGTTYDSDVITVTVDVTDNGKGKLIAKIKDEDVSNDAVNVGTFENVYKTYGEFKFPIKKTFTGREWKAGDVFQFEVVILDSATQTAAANGDIDLQSGTVKEIKYEDAEKVVETPLIKVYKDGTYKFRVHEITTQPIPGVNYDGEPRDIEVTAKDNGKGQLKISWKEANNKVVDINGQQGLEFKNHYDAKSTEVYGHDDLTVEKSLIGRPEGKWLDNDEFTFVLAAADKDTEKAIAAYKVDNTTGLEMPAAELKVNKNNMAHAHFGNIIFHQAGTFKFTITEQPSGLAGVTDDQNKVRFVTIEVSDNLETGLLEVTNKTVTTKDANGKEVASDLKFTNTYKTGKTGISMEFDKVLTGRDMAAGEFQFQLKDKDGNVVKEFTNETATDGNKAAIKYEESNVYTSPGVYKYTLSEGVPADDAKKGGVTYDDTVFDVIVTVTDNNDGTLSSATAYEKDGQPVTDVIFNNTYKAESVEVDFNGTKVLTGRDWKAGDEFQFKITTDTQDAPMPKNNVVKTSGTAFEFDKITFDKAGSYTYRISEVIPADAVKDEKGNYVLDGITYDTNEIAVTVNVTDNGKGALVAEIKDDDVSNDEVNVGSFENVYIPAPVSVIIDGAKVLKGRELAAGEFTFQLKDKDGKVLQEAVNDGDGSFAFAEIPYDVKGVHEYTVTEVKGNLKNVTYSEDVFNVIVTVTDNGDGTLSTDVEKTLLGKDLGAINFENIYTPDPINVKLTAEKLLKGRDWFDDDEFEFKLAPEGDTRNDVKNGIVNMPSSLTETADKDNKTVTFGDIGFTKAGTYNFVITETKGNTSGIVYDGHQLHAIVTVTDDSQGTLSAGVSYIGNTVFENKFTPDAVTVILTGEKILQGRDLNDDDVFTFEIAELTNGAPMPDDTTVTNYERKKISFAPITYTAAGTYKYKITEVKGNIPGITYDKEPVIATVTVEYDYATGKLSADVAYDKTGGFVFTNEYTTKETDPVDFNVVKKVDPVKGANYDLKAGDFTFELVEGQKVVQSKSNKADGSVEFDSITYDKAGTYTYTVREASGNIGGIEYDDTTYTVEVTVTDNGKGKLEREIKVDGKKTDDVTLEFTNIYEPGKTSAVFAGTKVLDSEHRALEADEFTFELKDEKGDVIGTAANDASGAFSFKMIEYDTAGTYKYTVNEVKGTAAGVTYDDAVYEITVTVEDVNGELTAETVIKDADEIVFTNGYEPASANLVIGGQKKLEGRDLAKGEFTFELKDADGKVIADSVNTADGTFAFDAVEFEKAGTYNYTVSEKDTNAGGITYDAGTYAVTVKVIDENGVLQVESVEYMQNGETVKDIVFNNSYKPAPTVIQLGAVKVLEGRDLTKGEFEFVLEDEKGNALQTKQNAADGTVTFDEITYDATGTYVYKIYEKSGDVKDVAYDQTAYKVTVKVTDDLAGNLKAAVEGIDDGIVFKNVYEPKIPHLNIEKMQSVNGGKATKDTLIVKEGDIITYYVRVWSDGECAAENLIIKDAIPEGLELIKASLAAEDGVLGEDGKTITWTIDKLEPGKDAVVTFQVKAPLAEEDQLDADGYQHWYNIASVVYGNNPDNPDDPSEPGNPGDTDEPDKEIPSNEVEVKEPLPEEPTAPMDETSDGGTQTGDDFNTGLYGFLVLAALAVAGAALRRRKTE